MSPMLTPRPRAADFDNEAIPFLESLIAWNEDQPRWRKAWWAIVRAVKKTPSLPRRARGVVVRAWQRLRRGWDFTALYSLDNHLTATLGAQLVEMGNIAHGWPATADFPEFEDWQNALHVNGRKLLAYRDAFWSSPEYQAVIDDARDALRWVADNLDTLWD